MTSGLLLICFEAQKMRRVGIAGAAVGEFAVPLSLPAYGSSSANRSLVRNLWEKKSKIKLLGSREFGRDLHS